jgi:DNA-binding transcriptional regulator YdaS (Cro superfamily)
MQLATWIRSRPRGEKARLARVVGCHLNTILYLCAGERPASFRIAAAIARATNHRVSIAELCAPKRRKRVQARRPRKRRKG